MHQRHQGLALVSLQQLLKIIQVYMALIVQLYKAQLYCTLLSKILNSVQSSMVLYRGGNNMLTAQIFHRSPDGSITAFRTARGKEDLSRLAAQYLSYRLTGSLNGHFGLP